MWDMIMELKKRKVSAVYISHDIGAIYNLADRFVILDTGIKIGEFKKGEISLEDLTNIIREGKNVISNKL